MKKYFICGLVFFAFSLILAVGIGAAEKVPPSAKKQEVKKEKKKKMATSRQVVSKPSKPSRKKEKPIEKTSAGYPWEKLRDADVLFALVLTGLGSFAVGVAYFQLYWRKRLPPPSH